MRTAQPRYLCDWCRQDSDGLTMYFPPGRAGIAICQKCLAGATQSGEPESNLEAGLLTHGRAAIQAVREKLAEKDPTRGIVEWPGTVSVTLSTGHEFQALYEDDHILNVLDGEPCGISLALTPEDECAVSWTMYRAAVRVKAKGEGKE